MSLPPPRRSHFCPRIGFLPRFQRECDLPPCQTTRRVSVVIPAYNAAATIREALDSFCRQTVKPCEIIVVNDGSTDGTWDVLGNLVMMPIRTYCKLCQDNRGASATRNAGVRVASGEYIIFADADDVAPPDRIETTLAEFAASGTEVVYGQKEWFDRDCQQRRQAPRATMPTPRTIVGATGYGTQALACKRSVFVEHGAWFDESMSVAEDSEHLVACLSRGLRVHCTKQVVCWQRRTEGSLRDRGDWGLMRQWITVKHREWLGRYMGREMRIAAQVEETVLAARGEAGWE